MKIITILILLIVTLLLVPFFIYFFAIPLGPFEWKALKMLLIFLGFVWAYCFVEGELYDNNSQVVND